MVNWFHSMLAPLIFLRNFDFMRERLASGDGEPGCTYGIIPGHWVAVQELKLSYYIGETLLFTIYTQYGNLI